MQVMVLTISRHTLLDGVERYNHIIVCARDEVIIWQVVLVALQVAQED